MHASDVMTTHVISVNPDMPVREVARLFVEQKISGAPVVDSVGRVVGIISESDLLHRSELGTDKRQRSSWLKLFSASEDARDYIKSHALKVKDVMSTPVIFVSEDTSIRDVADLLETRRVKRVPVLKGGELTGIISRANLVRALASLREDAPPDIEVSDSEIRAVLMGELAEREWALAGRNIVVNSGIVHLWGIFHSADAIAAVRVAAEGIPGVKRVEDHTERYP